MNSTNPRPKQMTKLLEKISHNLPDLNITFTGHDQPWVSLSSLSYSDMGEGKVVMMIEADSNEEKWVDCVEWGE